MLLTFKSDKELNRITNRDIRRANPVLRRKSDRSRLLSNTIASFIVAITSFIVVYPFFNIEEFKSWTNLEVIFFYLGSLTLLGLLVLVSEIHFRYLQKLGQEAASIHHKPKEI